MSTSNTVVDSSTTQEQIDSYLNSLSKKYLANNEYILSSTNAGILTAGVNALTPYSNFTNRYFPSVATLPFINDNLKTKAQLGGYYLPNNLGASVYLTKNITYSLNTSQIQNGEVYSFPDPARYNKGRGLTETDQSNIVEHIVNTDWIKSKNVSDQFDGNIINTDTFQKFIPYQSAYENIKADSNGVINAQYDYEFWIGDEKQIWNQSNNTYKLTQEKYFNLDGRIANLIFTPNQELYSWNTDIFGNQYGLYKIMYNPRSEYALLTSTGNLWVKTIDSTVNTGPSALNLIYSNYINNSTVYSQLTGNNIVNLDVFFDTLVIQLSSTVLYEKIVFNYDTYRVQGSLQSFRPLYYGLTSSAALSTTFLQDTIGSVSPTAQTFYGGNWYNPTDKTITICTLLSATLRGAPTSIISTSNTLSSIVVPVLYQLNLNNPTERKRVYPTNTTPNTNFIEYVYPIDGESTSEIAYMEAPVFSYNKDTNLYLISFLSFTSHSQQTHFGNYKVSITN
jgi:hypothetical protein